ncbi:hypothetical protein D3C81_2278310 [compost metagenome]
MVDWVVGVGGRPTGSAGQQQPLLVQHAQRYGSHYNVNLNNGNANRNNDSNIH